MMSRTHFKGLAGAAALAIMAGLASAPATAAPVTYTVADAIAGNDGGWDYVSFDPAMRRVYVPHADGVFVVDVDSGKVVNPHLADTPHPHEIVPLAGGKTLAVTVGGDNTLRFIDSSSGKLLGQVTTGAGPDAAIFDPTSGLVLVADHKGGDLLLVDAKTMKSVGSIAIGGALEFLATDGSGRAFINVEDKNELVAVDLKSKAVIKHLALPGCDGPTGMIYAPDAHAIVSSCDGKAAVVDAKTLTVSAMLDIGKGPDAVLYDPERHVALIPCGSSGELDVLTTKGKVASAGKVETEKSARTGAVDPKTGKVYLAAAKFGPPPPGSRRGPMVPGSFHLVVVSPSR